jgi:hypothetical protein
MRITERSASHRVRLGLLCLYVDSFLLGQLDFIDNDAT